MTAVEELSSEEFEVGRYRDTNAQGYWAPLLPPDPPTVMPWVDVATSGRKRLTALHELAHLLASSTEPSAGHGPGWADCFERLIKNYLSPEVAALWRVEFDYWTDKAAEKIAAHQLWLAP